MKRRLFSILLILAVGILSANAQRYDFSAIGPSGDTLYYKINTDSSSVTVVSPSPNYWYYMQGYHHAYHIIIPSFATDSSDSTTYVVRAIGDSAFYYCVHLSSVVIGDSIRTIGNWAFAYTTWLSSVTLGCFVTRIGTGAFFDARTMTEVTIPESVTYIGDNAFRIYNLRTVNFNASNCTYCGQGPYINNTGSYNETIYRNVFGDYPSPYNYVSTVNFGDNVKSIPAYAFYGCKRLKSIIIPLSLSIIA